MDIFLSVFTDFSEDREVQKYVIVYTYVIELCGKDVN